MRALLVLLFVAVYLSLDMVGELSWTTTRRMALLGGLMPCVIMLLGLKIIFLMTGPFHDKKMMESSWQQQQTMHCPRTLEFSNEQVVSSNEVTTINWRWDAFVRFGETQSLFTLVTEDSSFLMVPKRAFADPRMEQEFRRLIQANIGEGYFLTQPQGV